MKKLLLVAGITYLVTRHWDQMPERDKTKTKQQAKDLVYKTAQFVGRELEELDYRMAWKRLGR